MPRVESLRIKSSRSLQETFLAYQESVKFTAVEEGVSSTVSHHLSSLPPAWSCDARSSSSPLWSLLWLTQFRCHFFQDVLSDFSEQSETPPPPPVCVCVVPKYSSRSTVGPVSRDWKHVERQTLLLAPTHRWAHKQWSVNLLAFCLRD